MGEDVIGYNPEDALTLFDWKPLCYGIGLIAAEAQSGLPVLLGKLLYL